MAKASQEQKKREAEAKKAAVAAAKAELEQLTQRVPASYSGWSYQRAVDYKTAMADAKRVLKSERVKPEVAQQAVAALRLASR